MDQLDFSKYAVSDAPPPPAPDFSKFAVKQETLPPDVLAKYAIMPAGKATVRDDADFSAEQQAQGDELARLNRPAGVAIDISRGDLLPERGVRVSIPVYNEDTPETLLQRGMELTSKHLGLRGADAEAATKEALDYLHSQGIAGALRADSDEPISKDEMASFKLKGTTTFDSSHPGLRSIFDKYITAGLTGPGSGQTPNELINSRQLRKEVERLPSVMQGYVSSLGSVNHDIGGAMAIGGMEHADEFIESADAGARVAEEVMRESPDQSTSANLQRGFGRAIPQAAEMMSLQQTGAALPIMGALKHGGEGKAAMLEGAAEGAAMQAGMGGTSALGVGRVGNAALWTIVPTAQGISAGKSASQALGDALPFGLMAGMEGGREAEEPLTLGRLVGHSEAAHVERAPVGARPGVVGNADGTITVTVPATDGSGHLSVTVRPSFSRAQALRTAAKMRVNLTRLEAGTMTDGEKQGLMEFYGVGDEKHLAQFFRDRVDELKSHAFGSQAGQLASETRATNAPEGVGQGQASISPSSAPAGDGGEWQPFPAQSGSLNIPRVSMPQIKSEYRGAMVQFLKGRGITHSQEEVLPSALKPSQAEYSPEKVERARGFEGEPRSILVSSDDHVLDGHHQWLSSLADAPHEPIPAIRLHAPAHQLLIEAARFPSSGVDEASGGTSSNASREGQQSVAPPRAASPSAPASKYDALMEVSHAFDGHDERATDAAYDRAIQAGATDAEIRAAMVGDLPPMPKEKSSRIGQQIQDVMNVPRTLKHAYTVSAPFRQGLVLTTTHPLKAARAMGAMLKSFGSQEYADRAQSEILNSPHAPLQRESGLFIANPDSNQISGREELLASRLAGHLPGVHAGVRAQTVFLNKMRSDIFNSVVESRPDLTPEDLHGIARFINYASGRGDLGKLEKVAPVLSNVFFAPRLTLSRFQLATTPFRGTSAARSYAAGQLVHFAATGLATLGLAKVAGADVTLDPRKSDFGKVVVGNTRVDLGGGFIQVVRPIAQMFTGVHQSKNGVGARSRGEAVGRFFRSRLSPQAGFVVDVATGKTLMGEEVTAAKAAGDLLLPISWTEIYKAVRQDRDQGNSGLRGLAVSAPSLVGVRAATYPPKTKSGGHK